MSLHNNITIHYYRLVFVFAVNCRQDVGFIFRLRLIVGKQTTVRRNRDAYLLKKNTPLIKSHIIKSVDRTMSCVSLPKLYWVLSIPPH